MEKSERESLIVRMRHGDDDCATDEDNTDNKEETLQTNKLGCGSFHSAHTSIQLMFSWVSTCFRSLNMLLCLSLCIRVITSLVVNVLAYSLFTCM